jgi:diamine N-acetyltransferase
MVWLRNATKDDYSLDLDVYEDQHQFVASYKSILDYAFIEQDKEHTHAYIICEDDVAVGVVEYSDLYEIMAYNLSYIFIDRRYQNKSYGLKAVQLLLQKLGQEKKFDKVSVTLFEKNEVARKLYEKVGFVPNGFVFEDEYDMEMSI